MLYFAFISMTPGAPEMILIFLAVLLLFGAKNLPKIARNMGRTLEEFRRAAHDVSSEIMNADEELETYTPPTVIPPAELSSTSAQDAEIVEEDSDEQH